MLMLILTLIQYPGETGRRKLRSLAIIENFRGAIAREGILERLDTVLCVHRV